jgi:hypothetical protein
MSENVQNHVAPSRPGWTCKGCGEEWPCIPRKRQLWDLFEGTSASLTTYMASYLVDASRELPHLSTLEVATRLVGWCEDPAQKLAYGQNWPGGGPTTRR